MCFFSVQVACFAMVYIVWVMGFGIAFGGVGVVIFELCFGVILVSLHSTYIGLLFQSNPRDVSC